MQTSSVPSAAPLPQMDKPRYEWIDNARVVAALLIIYVHMESFFPAEPHVNNELGFSLTRLTTYYGRVPFFLILAGYFLARRITWHKAVDRALWLFIPFVAWNVLYYLWTHIHASISFSDIPWIIGVGPFFSKDTILFADYGGTPYIGISWFLRDIIVLSLLTPIFYRLRRVFSILLVIIVSLDPWIPLSSNTTIIMAPGNCFYYLLGVCLVDFRIADAYRILNKKFTPFLIVGLAVGTAISFYTAYNGLPSVRPALIGSVFGALMIAQSGVLIEKHLPKLSKLLAPCGPACFLVFMLHQPLFQMAAPFLPKWLTGSWLVWLLPFPACAGIITFFLLMKKFTPCLMPYLAHMKMPKKA